MGLYKDGQMVEAQRLLQQVLDHGASSMLTDEQATMASKLIRRVNDRLREMDPAEVSLQKAEVAARDGDLIIAEQHASAVLGQATLAEARRERAEAVLATVEARRAEFAPMIADAVTQAQRDFTAGRIAEAKAGLVTILRSGVKLNEAQQQLVAGLQLDVLEAEADSVLTAAVMQPGTVRRPGNGQEQPEPAAQPEPEVAPEPVQEGDLIQQAMQADARRYLAEADMAFQEARWNRAIELYNLLQTSMSQYLNQEELARVEERLQEARVQARRGGGDLGRQTLEQIELIRQETELEFANLIQQAQQRLNEEDVQAARDRVAQARLRAAARRTAYSEAEYEEKFESVLRTMTTRINDRAEQIQQRQLAEATRLQQDRARKAEETRRQERDRRILEGLDRVRALQREQKYEEALQVVDQVLFLDPRNPSALLLHDIISDVIVYQRYNQIQRQKAHGHVGLTLDTEEAMIPPVDIIGYPEDWPEKTIGRGEQSAYNETPENRRVLAKMESTRVPAQFTDNTLEDVLSFIETVTALNIDVDWQSLEEIGIDRDTLITMNLSDMPVNVLLDRILAKASPDAFSRADWAINDGILLVASDQDLRQHTTLVIYNITDLLLEIPDYDNVPEIDLESVLQQGEGGQGQSPFEDDDEDEEEGLTREEKIERITDIIMNIVDFEGWRENGGETGSILELGGSLIITNTPKNHREIAGLLSKLREIRNMQINVETRFLLVNQDWFEQIGFDIDVVFNADNNQVRAARAVDPAIRPSDFFDFSEGGGLQRSITGPIPGGDEDPITQAVLPPERWSPIGVGQNSLGLTNSLAIGEFAAGIISSAPALGIAGQFLDDVQVDFLIQATQADRRSVQLTAPRLTFTNGQTANIFVVTQQAFVSDLQPVVGESAVGFDPEVSVASEGVTMLVEGVISADRRYVTLNMDAGVARIDGFAEQSVSAVAGGQLVDSADVASFIQLPTITVTRVRTTVTVPDEGTVLLGGQRLITEVEVETGVPVLSKIPIISRFFTNRLESKEEQTLLILAKPTVLIQAEQEERAYPGLLDSVRTGAF